MKVDILITNGKLVTHEGIYDQMVVGISGEKIAFVGADDHKFEVKKTMDVGGNYILPGIIDIHTHFADFRPYEDDVLSETKGAAAGGITTIFNFIMELGSLCELLPQFKETTNRLATVDMGFHCACSTETHLNEIARCREIGIKGFKFFMSYKGDEMKPYGIQGIDLPYLYRGMEKVKQAGGIVQVHAENYDLIELFKERHIHKNDFYSFNLSRPAICQEIDAFTACSMAEKVGCPLYIVHVGAGNVLDIVKLFRARKNKVYIEAGPRWLNIDDKGTGLKRPELAIMTPAYYTKADAERVWDGLATGEVDTVGTDSGAMSYSDKVKDGVVWNMLPGWMETPTSLATMLSEGVNKNRITLPQLVTLMSYNPAKIFDLHPRKGEILPGSDADITVVDLDRKLRVKADLFPSANDFTPYEDWELKGWPILTMVRGKVVMEEGKVLDAVGWGKAVNLG
jgi:dihydropyrimidinase